MTALTHTFDFQDTPVRIMGTPDHPLFVAADVCRVLEIANPRDAVAEFDDDERGVATTDTPGGQQLVTCITEPGLYRLIFKSRKDKAKQFQRWVLHEVLPQIRQQGFYMNTAVDFDRYPVAREFTDLFGFCRKLGISADIAAQTAKSLLWKGGKLTDKQGIQNTNVIDHGGAVLDLLADGLAHGTAMVCEAFKAIVGASRSTFYRTTAKLIATRQISKAGCQIQLTEGGK